MQEFQVVTVKPVKGIAIRERVKHSDIGPKMGEIYGRLMMHANMKGLPLTGAPFALYHDYDQETTDMECGFPVGSPTAGEGGIGPCTLPGGEVVMGVHVGPYDRLMDTYSAMQAWMTEKGLVPTKMMWERYLTDPAVEKDPAKFVTEIYWPVERA